MTTEVYNILLGLGVMLILLVASCELRAQEPNSEYLKQILRLQYTEFCAEVKPPPAMLIKLLDELIPHNPQLGQSGKWVNDIIDGLAKRKCGDA